MGRLAPFESVWRSRSIGKTSNGERKRRKSAARYVGEYESFDEDDEEGEAVCQGESISGLVSDRERRADE